MYAFSHPIYSRAHPQVVRLQLVLLQDPRTKNDWLGLTGQVWGGDIYYEVTKVVKHLRLRPPNSCSPALPQVGPLYPDCRLAVFDDISIRHLVRPPFRHASEERFEARSHLPELTKGQRRDAPYLREPPLSWAVATVDAKGVAVQPHCLLLHHLGGVQLLLGDTGGEAGALRTPPL
jgi:hypothetical protein